MTDFTINAAFGPMLWGTDKGYFSSRGIELDLIPGEGSDDALNQINTDKVDFAFVDMGNYMEQRISGDTPTQAIYALMNISTTGLVSLFEINEPADMAGKSFGTVVFSSGKEKIPEILQANGVDYPGVGEPGSLIELMDFSVLYPTLFEGKIDTAEAGLAGSWESAFVSAREQGKVLYFKPISDWGFLDYSKVMIVRDDLIASDPDLVARMVAAMYESQNDSFANATGADIHKLLLELDPQAEQERVELVWQSFTTYVKNPGPMEASVVQFQLDRLANSDPPITTDLKPEDFFTNEYIPQQ